ncbi:Monocarboxylate transporter [Colletotrichum scovillei]|uniref:Monocarboxylate transporter n=1 Tax=Colletotrichum scovillei TaxID=1209932 RepID=A0A9P7REE4_9PEZI|nr:Monocarboxylate transporter [Colletotrichum scovillei]KAG7075229.1 Monocarboxylate transporter [Colletotrichum scovillei]KAG7082229.1 Monocarboxylate transporter [Colletotrichum scovillei]
MAAHDAIIPIDEANIIDPVYKINGANRPRPYPRVKGPINSSAEIGPVRILPTPLPNAMKLYTCPGSSERVDPNLFQRHGNPPVASPNTNEKESRGARDEAKPQTAKVATAATNEEAKTRTRTLLTRSVM